MNTYPTSIAPTDYFNQSFQTNQVKQQKIDFKTSKEVKQPSEVTMMIQGLWRVYDQSKADGRKCDVELAANGLLKVMHLDFRRLVRRTGATGADEEDFHAECRHALAVSMMLYSEKSGRNFRTDVIWRARTYMRRLINKREAYFAAIKLESDMSPIQTSVSRGLYTEPKTEDIAPASEDDFNDVEARIIYERSMEILNASSECNERDIEIFNRYYKDEVSMYQIGVDMGLNPQIVTRSITRCLKIVQRRLWDSNDTEKN